MTPCKPSRTLDGCSTCRRYEPRMPDDAARRPMTTCIDAIVLTKPGASCVMRLPLVRSAELEAFLRDEASRAHG